MTFFQTGTLWVDQLGDCGGAVVFDRRGSAVNTIDAETLRDLEEALERIARDGGFQHLIPASFCHGLDRAYLGSLTGPGDLFELSRRGQEVCDRLSNLPSAPVWP